MPSQPAPPRPRGFTLIELLIAIAVLGVLLTLAAPSFRDFILMQRLKGINAQVVTDMQLARSEAASRGLMVNVRVQPAGANGAMSCYILFTDRDMPIPSSRCDCTRAAGARCAIAGTTEIRTVQVPRTDHVFLTVPAGQDSNFAYDPVSGGIVMALSESGNPIGNPFTILASIDGPRSLGTSVALSGRPSVCRPAGSSLNEPLCP